MKVSADLEANINKRSREILLFIMTQMNLEQHVGADEQTTHHSGSPYLLKLK